MGDISNKVIDVLNIMENSIELNTNNIEEVERIEQIKSKIENYEQNNEELDEMFE